VSFRRSRVPCSGADVPEWVAPLVLPTPYPIGPVTVYLLEGEPLTLVDTGPATRAARHALVAALTEHGVGPGAIRRVLLTHGHHDHFGQARWLARHGATLFAHPFDARNLRKARSYPLLWRQLRRSGLPAGKRLALIAALRALDLTARPVRGFEALGDGMELPHSHGPIRVYHLPGHTPGHVGFELAGERAIITGDTILDGITPNAVIDTDPARPEQPFLSLAAYAETLLRLESLHPRLLLPAHGPCISDVAGHAATLRLRQQERAEEVLAALRGGSATVAELIGALFPGVKLLGLFLAFSEVLGHLLELERRGAVRRVSALRPERWQAAA
jgi:glyoxylase-like metal-dependent hydrolase (beta-lactamase superfamily II)